MIFLFYVDISRPDHPLSSIFVYTTVCLMDDSKLSCPKCTNLQNLFLIQSPLTQLMPSPSTQASKQDRKLKILLFSHHLSSNPLVFQQVPVYLSKIYLKSTSFSPLISTATILVQGTIISYLDNWYAYLHAYVHALPIVLYIGNRLFY